MGTESCVAGLCWFRIRQRFSSEFSASTEGDSPSTVTPWRVVNFGNSIKVRLEDFIGAIEVASGHKVIGNPMDMQQGDVPATWADESRLEKLTGYRPATEFVKAWHGSWIGTGSSLTTPWHQSVSETMNVAMTARPDVLVISPRRFGDSRGWFCETRTRQVLRAPGLDWPDYVHDSGSYADQVRFVSDCPGHDARQAIDTKRICTAPGWRPSVIIEAGLARKVGWYLANDAWWQVLQARHRVGLWPGVRT